MYFIISLLHLSVLYARSFIFHMTGFLIIVGPLHWPMSDLKAIKHKTFCKTRMPLCARRPCNACRGNYDNNSVAVGVARSLWRGWGAMGQGSPRASEQGQVKVACWASPPPPPSLPVVNSFHHAARYTAEPFCLVAAGDKARADGKAVVLAPWQWRGQLRILSWQEEENAWVNTTPVFALWGS